MAAPVFAAPPAVSAEGVIVDPFGVDPYSDPGVIPPATAPMLPPGDGGSSRLHIPVTNREWAWEQIVDVVDDYFRVGHERQVQLVGDVLTEGRIDVIPQVGATLAEPHRRDSVGRYNRWESTLQTIRRRAVIRVIPDSTGLLVDITVEKDLEDLPRPEYATAGAAAFRNDNSLPTDSGEAVSRTDLYGRWILIGRDPALEQRMLAEIQARLAPQAATPAPF
jgi:hypothetical protein